MAMQRYVHAGRGHGGPKGLASTTKSATPSDLAVNTPSMSNHTSTSKQNGIMEAEKNTMTHRNGGDRQTGTQMKLNTTNPMNEITNMKPIPEVSQSRRKNQRNNRGRKLNLHEGTHPRQHPRSSKGNAEMNGSSVDNKKLISGSAVDESHGRNGEDQFPPLPSVKLVSDLVTLPVSTEWSRPRSHSQIAGPEDETGSESSSKVIPQENSMNGSSSILSSSSSDSLVMNRSQSPESVLDTSVQSITTTIPHLMSSSSSSSSSAPPTDSKKVLSKSPLPASLPINGSVLSGASSSTTAGSSDSLVCNADPLSSSSSTTLNSVCIDETASTNVPDHASVQPTSRPTHPAPAPKKKKNKHKNKRKPDNYALSSPSSPQPDLTTNLISERKSPPSNYTSKSHEVFPRRITSRRPATTEASASAMSSPLPSFHSNPNFLSTALTSPTSVSRNFTSPAPSPRSHRVLDVSSSHNGKSYRPSSTDICSPISNLRPPLANHSLETVHHALFESEDTSQISPSNIADNNNNTNNNHNTIAMDVHANISSRPMLASTSTFEQHLNKRQHHKPRSISDAVRPSSSVLAKSNSVCPIHGPCTVTSQSYNGTNNRYQIPTNNTYLSTANCTRCSNSSTFPLIEKEVAPPASLYEPSIFDARDKIRSQSVPKHYEDNLIHMWNINANVYHSPTSSDPSFQFPLSESSSSSSTSPTASSVSSLSPSLCHSPTDHIPPIVNPIRRNRSKSYPHAMFLSATTQISSDISPPLEYIPPTVSPKLTSLHNEVLHVSKLMGPNKVDTLARREVLKRVLHAIINLWPNIEIHVIGSCATNLFLPDSDIDLVVRKPQSLPAFTVNDLHVLARELQPLATSVQVISTASVPLIKLVDNISNYTLDITLNVDTGLYSTTLVRHYLNMYPALRPLTIVLKQFLKARQLNDLYSGGLPSYCLILLIVSFLQFRQVSNPHPNDQATSTSNERHSDISSSEESSEDDYEEDTIEILSTSLPSPHRIDVLNNDQIEKLIGSSHLSTNAQSILKGMEDDTLGQLSVDELSCDLGQSLLAFLELYGKTFPYGTVGISLRDEGGWFIKKNRNWLHAHNPNLLCVENPLEPNMDLGFKVFRIGEIKAAFAEAYDFLSNSGTPASITQITVAAMPPPISPSLHLNSPPLVAPQAITPIMYHHHHHHNHAYGSQIPILLAANGGGAKHPMHVSPEPINDSNGGSKLQKHMEDNGTGSDESSNSASNNNNNHNVGSPFSPLVLPATMASSSSLGSTREHIISDGNVPRVSPAPSLSESKTLTAHMSAPSSRASSPQQPPFHSVPSPHGNLHLPGYQSNAGFGSSPPPPPTSNMYATFPTGIMVSHPQLHGLVSASHVYYMAQSHSGLPPMQVPTLPPGRILHTHAHISPPQQQSSPPHPINTNNGTHIHGRSSPLYYRSPSPVSASVPLAPINTNIHNPLHSPTSSSSSASPVYHPSTTSSIHGRRRAPQPLNIPTSR